MKDTPVNLMAIPDSPVNGQSIPMNPVNLLCGDPRQYAMGIFDLLFAHQIYAPSQLLEQVRWEIYRRAVLDYVNKDLAHATFITPEYVYTLVVSAFKSSGLIV